SLEGGAMDQDLRGIDAPEQAGSAAATPALTAYERGVIAAIAEAAIPAGRFLEGAGEATVGAVEELLASLTNPTTRMALRAGYAAVELATVATHGRPFSTLPLE